MENITTSSHVLRQVLLALGSLDFSLRVQAPVNCFHDLSHGQLAFDKAIKPVDEGDRGARPNMAPEKMGPQIAIVC